MIRTRPIPKPLSPEVRAKLSAAAKRMWEDGRGWTQARKPRVVSRTWAEALNGRLYNDPKSW